MESTAFIKDLWPKKKRRWSRSRRATPIRCSGESLVLLFFLFYQPAASPMKSSFRLYVHEMTSILYHLLLCNPCFCLSKSRSVNKYWANVLWLWNRCAWVLKCTWFMPSLCSDKLLRLTGCLVSLPSACVDMSFLDHASLKHVAECSCWPEMASLGLGLARQPRVDLPWYTCSQIHINGPTCTTVNLVFWQCGCLREAPAASMVDGHYENRWRQHLTLEER